MDALSQVPVLCLPRDLEQLHCSSPVTNSARSLFYTPTRSGEKLDVCRPEGSLPLRAAGVLAGRQPTAMVCQRFSQTIVNAKRRLRQAKHCCRSRVRTLVPSPKYRAATDMLLRLLGKRRHGLVAIEDLLVTLGRFRVTLNAHLHEGFGVLRRRPSGSNHQARRRMV